MVSNPLPSQEYVNFLNSVKDQIQQSRIRAFRVVNRELLLLYQNLGRQIVEAQEKYGWGRSIVENLSKDLMKLFPGNSGFSPRNLWLMRQFHLEYVKFAILQPLVAEIPWAHNIAIMSRVSDLKAREYYIKATIELGWSKNVLMLQIKSMAYERRIAIEKQNNFDEVLPEHLAEQADLAMKDSYMLDFLGIKKPVVEAHLERQMILRIKDVILELGFGFAFISNQYKVKTPTNDYFIDLLFYNRYLKCLVAVELKAGAFKPEYAGKMNFYLNLLDDFTKAQDDNPSIGIILCSERDKFDVEYALRGLNKPVGIAEYRLTKDLPSELADKLPSAKILEDELTATCSAVMQMELFTEEEPV